MAATRIVASNVSAFRSVAIACIAFANLAMPAAACTSDQFPKLFEKYSEYVLGSMKLRTIVAIPGKSTAAFEINGEDTINLKVATMADERTNKLKSLIFTVAEKAGAVSYAMSGLIVLLSCANGASTSDNETLLNQFLEKLKNGRGQPFTIDYKDMSWSYFPRESTSKMVISRNP